MQTEEVQLRHGIDFPGLSVTFFCHDGRGRFLMGKRTQNCRDEHGCWDPGGGKIEIGDTQIDTIHTEIGQEYGTTVISHEFLGHREVLRRLDSGTLTHWVSFDFKVLIDPTKVRNAEPHKQSEIGWFTFENLPDPLHSQFPHFLKKYRSRLIQVAPVR